MSLPTIPLEPGDLAIVPDNGTAFIAVVDEVGEDYRIVRWGDCERRVPAGLCGTLARRYRPRSLGALIGRKFTTPLSLVIALNRHRHPCMPKGSADEVAYLFEWEGASHA